MRHPLTSEDVLQKAMDIADNGKVVNRQGSGERADAAAHLSRAYVEIARAMREGNVSTLTGSL